MHSMKQSKPVIYAIIPARSKSKGILNKNIKEICGIPLIGFSIAFAKSLGVDKIICSTDSDEYAKIAIKYGVPEKKIYLTEIAMNTDQEAKSIKKLISNTNTKIILVTSAFHMPRAQKVFKAAGLNVVPYAVDFRNRYTNISLMSFIPSAYSFEETSLFVREMIGRTYYNLKY